MGVYVRTTKNTGIGVPWLVAFVLLPFIALWWTVWFAVLLLGWFLVFVAVIVVVIPWRLCALAWAYGNRRNWDIPGRATHQHAASKHVQDKQLGSPSWWPAALYPRRRARHRQEQRAPQAHQS